MMKVNFLNRVIWWGLVVSCFLGWSSAGLAATWYVRTDGGAASQCTGQVDAPYPGSGTAMACAWSHPFWALDASGAWKIVGGDSLIIHSGSYRMGFGAPNTEWCEQAWAYDCHLPPLPSGPSPAEPTRILGSGWDQECSHPPELWGAERPWQVLSLAGTSNAVIGCLEITDHSGCVDSHANSAVRCERDTPPFGEYAHGGIFAVDASNVTLSHLNIHGLASFGIHAGRLTNWTVENVRLAGNGWVGWDGDTDYIGSGGSACHGDMIFRHFTVEWNGCGETWPQAEPHGCWAQTAGGYGDGMGLGATRGNWVFEDSIFRHNTSDGLDLLYALELSSITIRRTQAYGNAGDQIKVNGSTRIENSLMVSNCAFFEGQPFTYHVDNCRAGGSALSAGLRSGEQISVINATIAGEGDCLALLECVDERGCDSSARVIIQNNIFMGYMDFFDPDDRAAYIYFHPNVVGTVSTDYNLVFGAKISNVGLSANDLVQDPRVLNPTLANFDGRLKSGSPAIDSGLPVGSLAGLVPNHDLVNSPRPSGAGVDRGAYEAMSETTRMGLPGIMMLLLDE